MIAEESFLSKRYGGGGRIQKRLSSGCYDMSFKQQENWISEDPSEIFLNFSGIETYVSSWIQNGQVQNNSVNNVKEELTSKESETKEEVKEEEEHWMDEGEREFEFEEDEEEETVSFKQEFEEFDLSSSSIDPKEIYHLHPPYYSSPLSTPSLNDEKEHAKHLKYDPLFSPPSSPREKFGLKEEEESSLVSQLTPPESPSSPRKQSKDTQTATLPQSLSPIDLLSSSSTTKSEKINETSYLNQVMQLLALYGLQILLTLDTRGIGIIHYACKEGYLRVVEFIEKQLGKQGLQFVDAFGNLPLFISIQNNHLTIVSFLLSNGGDILQKNNRGQNVFRVACENSNVSILSYLLDRCPKFDINERDDQGKTLLHLACSLGNQSIIELLIKKGANTMIKDHLGATCLTTAVMLDLHEFLDLLIDNNTIIDSTDKFGRTPLHWASYVGNLNAVKFLIRNGAKLEQRDRKGRTPLLLASFSSQTPVLQFLRQKKANKDVEDFEGRVPNLSSI